jgi:hypothetical protein
LILFGWDVQGAEIGVFNEGEEMLKKTIYIYTEYSNKELYKGQYSLKKLLKKLATFKILTRYKHDVLLKNSAL